MIPLGAVGLMSSPSYDREDPASHARLRLKIRMLGQVEADFGPIVFDLLGMLDSPSPTRVELLILAFEMKLVLNPKEQLFRELLLEYFPRLYLELLIR